MFRTSILPTRAPNPFAASSVWPSTSLRNNPNEPTATPPWAEASARNSQRNATASAPPLGKASFILRHAVALTAASPAQPVLTRLANIYTWRAPASFAMKRAPVFGLRATSNRAAATLPIELQLDILRYIDTQTLISFAAVSRDARTLAADIAEERYRMLCTRHRTAKQTTVVDRAHQPQAGSDHRDSTPDESADTDTRLGNRSSMNGDVPELQTTDHPHDSPVTTPPWAENADFLRYFTEAAHIERFFAAWPGEDEPRTYSVKEFPTRVCKMLNAVPVQGCGENWYDYLPPAPIENVRQAAYVLRFTEAVNAKSAIYLEMHAIVQAELGHADRAVKALGQMRHSEPPTTPVEQGIARFGVVMAAIRRDDPTILSAMVQRYRINSHETIGLAIRHGSFKVVEKMWLWGGRVSDRFMNDTRGELSGIAWKINSWGLLNPYGVPFDIEFETLDSRRRTVKWYQAKREAEVPWRYRRGHHRRMPVRNWI